MKSKRARHLARCTSVAHVCDVRIWRAICDLRRKHLRSQEVTTQRLCENSVSLNTTCSLSDKSQRGNTMSPRPTFIIHTIPVYLFDQYCRILQCYLHIARIYIRRITCDFNWILLYNLNFICDPITRINLFRCLAWKWCYPLGKGKKT